MQGLPKFPEFELLGLKHREMVELQIRKMQPVASELNFTEIFCWRPTRNTKICVIDGIIALDFEKKGIHYIVFLCPDCAIVPAAKIMLENYKKCGFESKVACLTEDSAAHFKKDHAFEVATDRDVSDYVYRTSDLINLPGRKYDGKRNQISQFLKNYSHEFIEVKKQNIPEVEEIQAEWCKSRNCEPGSVLSDENVAIEQMLENFTGLELHGAILNVNNKPAAYTLSGVLNKNTAVIYMEKGLRDYKGIYQAINQMYAEKYLSKYEFINREQDVGDDGLRHAKMSYHPNHLVHKYNVKLKI